MRTNATLEELGQALEEVNKKYDNNITWNRHPETTSYAIKESNKPFKCPNCNTQMKFSKQIIYDNEVYDEWVCPECPLLVFDWRCKE